MTGDYKWNKKEVKIQERQQELTEHEAESRLWMSAAKEGVETEQRKEGRDAVMMEWGRKKGMKK